MKYIFPLFLLTLSCLAQTSNPPVNVRIWGSDPTNVPPMLTNVVAIAQEIGGYNVALKADGSVVYWYGNTSFAPAQMTNCVAIDTGEAIIALTQSGQVIASDNSVPSDVTSAIAVASGFKRRAAVRPDGTVVTWGGLATTPPANATNVTAIALYSGQYVVLRADGTVVSWGGLGLNNVPAGLSNAVAVAAGSGHCLALKSDGRVAAWGDNTYGQCAVPADLTNAVAIGAGSFSSLAVKSDGSVVAWGNYGGSGGTSVFVPNDLPSAQAVAGGSSGSMAIVNPGQALSPPVIFSHPQSQTVASGTTVRFTVRAAGVPPFTYQWFFNGINPISGATNSSLSLNNVSNLNSGAYSVTVSNHAGGTPSQAAVLNVLPSLKIDLVPAISLIGDVGSTYTLQFINAVGATSNWQSLATVTLTNSPQFYPDYSAIGQPLRFYRILQGP